ncbi:MAG: DUF4186 family protein [Pyrinomonadaceae bacterium]
MLHTAPAWQEQISAATAPRAVTLGRTCCRVCLRKWHRIPKGRALDEREQGYVLSVIGRWLEGQ